MLLAYLRHDNSGHCINYLKSAPGWKDPVERYYFDYQHSDDGGSSKDNAADIRDAKMIVLLYHEAFCGSRSRNASTQQQEFEQYLANRERRKQALVAPCRLPAFFMDL